MLLSRPTHVRFAHSGTYGSRGEQIKCKCQQNFHRGSVRVSPPPCFGFLSPPSETFWSCLRPVFSCWPLSAKLSRPSPVAELFSTRWIETLSALPPSPCRAEAIALWSDVNDPVCPFVLNLNFDLHFAGNRTELEFNTSQFDRLKLNFQHLDHTISRLTGHGQPPHLFLQ